MSLLLADADFVAGAVASTEFLSSFFEHNEPCRELVRYILQELRDAGVLSPHGRGEAVGQYLKTAAAAIFCCGIISCSMPSAGVLASIDAPSFALHCCG